MNVRLLCGEKPLDLVLPEPVKVLDTKPMEPLADPIASIQRALAEPIGSPPLRHLIKGKKTACVVISDVTRPVPNKIILPPLLEVLEGGGIKREDITILIATGMHRPNRGEELASMVGSYIMDNYRILNHFCRTPEMNRKVDEIDGAPIEVNRHYLDADLKILTGLIEPHFYAGYSGGGKAILPGISSFETMKFMHSFEMIDSPRVTNCLLEGNPFHEYVIRVTKKVGADFILNVVINKERRVAGVFAGHFDRAHLAGSEMVRHLSTVPLSRPMDMVITSGGGYPLDVTFYQVSKAMICARNILRKGGTLIVVCECREGLGSPEFSGIIRSVCNPGEFNMKYSKPENLVIDQWCAQNIYQVLEHAGNVYIYSQGLLHEDLKHTGIFKIDDVQETVNELLDAHPHKAVVPDGPYVVGLLNPEIA